LDEKSHQLSELEGKIYDLINVNEELERLYLDAKGRLESQGQDATTRLQSEVSELIRINSELQDRLNIESEEWRVNNDTLTQEVFYYRDILTQEQDNSANLNNTLRALSEELEIRQLDLERYAERVDWLETDNEQKTKKAEELESQIHNFSYTV
jgi:chromosome segregation ATPase